MSVMNTGGIRYRILIVDDHAIVRQGLRDYIEKEADFTVCGEAAGSKDALQLCAETRPHLVLIDLSLGEDSGMDLLKEVATRFPETKSLVLSMQDELLYAERVLRAGAAGYVGKGESPAVMVSAIRRVLGGEVYASEAVKQKIMQSVRQVDPGRDPVSGLSDRELAVFEQIGRGISTADIAVAMNLSVKTVETYRARIKAKLNAENSAQLMQRAVQWAMDRSS